MTVSELILQLRKLPPESTIEVGVWAQTQGQLVALLEPSVHSGRIYVSFPEGIIVQRRKVVK